MIGSDGDGSGGHRGLLRQWLALAVAGRVALEEERALEAEAGTLEQRLEARLDRIGEQLADLKAHLRAGFRTAGGEAVSPRQEQSR